MVKKTTVGRRRRPRSGGGRAAEGSARCVCCARETTGLSHIALRRVCVRARVRVHILCARYARARTHARTRPRACVHNVIRARACVGDVNARRVGGNETTPTSVRVCARVWTVFNIAAVRPPPRRTGFKDKTRLRVPCTCCGGCARAPRRRRAAGERRRRARVG